MKTEEKEARDRVALIYSDEVSVGDRNVIATAEATPDWLEISNGLFIPWEWIDRARALLRKGPLELESKQKQRTQT